jgi:hypothetical protein
LSVTAHGIRSYIIDFLGVEAIENSMVDGRYLALLISCLQAQKLVLPDSARVTF